MILYKGCLRGVPIGIGYGAVVSRVRVNENTDSTQFCTQTIGYVNLFVDMFNLTLTTLNLQATEYATIAAQDYRTIDLDFCKKKMRRAISMICDQLTALDELLVILTSRLNNGKLDKL